jgi:hypothetical protein
MATMRNCTLVYEHKVLNYHLMMQRQCSVKTETVNNVLLISRYYPDMYWE